MKNDVDLESLEKTVSDLQRRIRDDRAYIAGHETRTRVVLIGPLLRAIGWDPERPNEVHLEFKATGGIPDYALMKSCKPVGFIEAKRLGSTLETQNPGQVIKYTNDPALKHCEMVAFTDGNVWTFFCSSSKWKPETIEITSGQTFKTAYGFRDFLSPSKLMALRATRPNEGNLTVVKGPGVWHPLVGELPNTLPTEVSIGEAAPTKWVSWKQLYADVAKYLVSSGYIRKSDLPVWVANGKYCAINDEPIHPGPDRKQFGKPVEVGNNMWLEAYGNRNALREYSGRLMRQFSDDPGSVQLRFD